MAEPNGEIYWHFPEFRAVFFPQTGMKLSRSLRQVLRKNLFEIRFNSSFERVIRECAQRPVTWISEEIITAYTQLHHMGYAHSVECWQNGSLVGGLYGVALNGVFFGESMFSKVSNASKVALYYLLKRLKEQNFLLLDSQYPNEHILSLGAEIVSAQQFLHLLQTALQCNCSFP